MSTFQNTFERKEVKYLLSDFQYRELRKRLEPVAAVDQYGETVIYNIYFDTPDFILVRRSLDKPIYKEKLRLRTYGLPGNRSNSFIELKKKYKGIVYKRRISMPYAEALHYLCEGKQPSQPPAEGEILREIDYFRSFYRHLEPVMGISYHRVAMAGRDDPELRITFDTDIRYSVTELDLREGNHGKQLLQPGQHLMELKVQNALRLDIARMLSRLGIVQTSYSKYGEGYLSVEGGTL